MSYWPQQLNFALWCATTGCGISICSLFDDDMTDSELKLPPQVRSFLLFHVYFTVRHILWEEFKVHFHYQMNLFLIG